MNDIKKYSEVKPVMKKRFLSVERMILLQSSIRWLDNYVPDGNDNVIGEGIEEHLVDKDKTAKLKRLGEINLEREQLIQSLLEDPSKLG